jgi:hypothetical protein
LTSPCQGKTNVQMSWTDYVVKFCERSNEVANQVPGRKCKE